MSNARTAALICSPMMRGLSRRDPQVWSSVDDGGPGLADREARVERAVLDVAGAQDQPARAHQAVDEGDHRAGSSKPATRSSTCQSRRIGA